MKEDYIMNTKVFNFGKVIKISVVILFLIVVFGIFKPANKKSIGN